MSRFYPNLFSVFNTFGELFYKKGSFPPISSEKKEPMMVGRTCLSIRPFLRIMPSLERYAKSPTSDPKPFVR